MLPIGLSPASVGVSFTSNVPAASISTAIAPIICQKIVSHRLVRAQPLWDARPSLAAPVGAFTPAVGVTLTGHGPWRLAAAWGGQFGSATSAENFSLEGRYVW